jgi:hypothetical protein
VEEGRLAEFVQGVRQQGAAVDQEVMVELARTVASETCHGMPVDAEPLSRGWVWSFRKRHGLSTLRHAILPFLRSFFFFPLALAGQQPPTRPMMEKPNAKKMMIGGASCMTF